MAEEVNTTRPNIRIEIHNNLMDVEDETSKLSDGEEGEIIEESVDFDDIIDDKISYPSRPITDDQNKPTNRTFSTGINIFDKEEQKKRSERARRFQLDHNEVSNFTTENLESLHESLGINAKNEKQICFDTLHLHGIENMTTHDIMNYFSKYAPTGIERIDTNSCNVVWADDVSSARALFYMSQRVKGMPVDNSMEVCTENVKGRSILLKNTNRDVVLDDADADGEVSISDIDIPIPPGYWRLGEAYKKTRYILMRFAVISDRQLNTDRGNYKKGLISESKKAQFRGIFDRNQDINTKNPWGDLAKSWNRDRKTEEVGDETPQPAPQLKHRLGFKRSQAVAFEKEEEEKPTEKPKIPRMRMYADEEEAKIKRKKALVALKRVATPVKTEFATSASSGSSDLRNVIRKRDTRDATDAREALITRTIPKDDDEIEDASLTRRINNDPDDSDLNPPYRQEVDLGNRLMNRKLKVQESLRAKPRKSPPPSARQSSNRNYSRYSNRDHYEENPSEDDGEVYSDDDIDVKTNSKVTVVIKKPKQPTVASTIWSRVNTTGRSSNPSVKDRLQMPVRPARGRKSRESSVSSDDGSASTSDESTRSSNDDRAMDVARGADKIKPTILSRPGFRGGLVSDKMEEHKSPLRIEINNDHYKK